MGLVFFRILPLWVLLFAQLSLASGTDQCGEYLRKQGAPPAVVDITPAALEYWQSADFKAHSGSLVRILNGSNFSEHPQLLLTRRDLPRTMSILARALLRFTGAFSSDSRLEQHEFGAFVVRLRSGREIIQTYRAILQATFLRAILKLRSIWF
jgi:hypothetical protein